MKKYIALTIGPIYKTLLSAKKSGELWSGSYLFSYIMKNIVIEFRDREVVLPVMKNGLFKKDKKERYQGAGFFSDRFIFESKDGDLDRLKRVIDQVIEKLAIDMDNHFKKALKNAKKYISKFENREDKKEILEFYQQKVNSLESIQNKKKEIERFLKEYLQINLFEKEVQNPIDDIYPILDMFELRQKVIYHEGINYLALFMQNINNSFLKEDAFSSSKGAFPSLPYIATKAIHDELENTDDIFDNSIDDSKIYDKLKGKLKNHHKYIAIVQADGDNIGSIISSLGDKEYQPFNRKLLKFTTSSNKKVKEYGGNVIYAGGDDLLFFAPVVGKKGDIFKLLKEIREIFEKELKEEIEKSDKKVPSVSFGLSISYYKYPLYEALQDSIDALYLSKNSGKNSITMKLLQHSGQYVQTTMRHNTKSYKGFERLIDEYLSIEDKSSMLSSFHHTIRKFEDVLKVIGKEPTAVRNFFDNNFNDAHKNQYKEFTDILVDYIEIVFNEESDEDKAIDRLYTALKIIKFLKG